MSPMMLFFPIGILVQPCVRCHDGSDAPIILLVIALIGLIAWYAATDRGR
jgi:hypothetical protein